MPRHDFQIPVTFKHRIVFTRDAFAPSNHELAEILREGGGRRALVVIESSVAKAWPGLEAEIESYFKNQDVELQSVHTMPGGETIKSDDLWVR